MDEVEELLGWPGRMIAASKSDYRRAHPDHAVVFNSNVCVAGEKRWHGDLDLTLQESLLRRLAVALKQRVAVLAERDGRFAHEQAPRLDRTLFVVDPSGDSWFDRRRFRRAGDGSLRRLAPARPSAPDRFDRIADAAVATVQDRPPNFRGADGSLYLIRCFRCDPTSGRENQLTSAAGGQCVWCGWSEVGSTAP